MPPRLPAKPRTSPLVTRTLVALALGVPACGAFRPVPSRIGPPPPLRRAPEPTLVEPPPTRIGPPSCYDESVAIVSVVVGEQREPLINQPITLSIRGVERIFTTDGYGQFKLQLANQSIHESIAATVPGYDTVDVQAGPRECYDPGQLRILLKPAGSPDIPHLQGHGRGTIIRD